LSPRPVQSLKNLPVDEVGAVEGESGVAYGVGLGVSRPPISVPLELDLVIAAGADVSDVSPGVVVLGGDAEHAVPAVRARSVIGHRASQGSGEVLKAKTNGLLGLCGKRVEDWSNDLFDTANVE